MKRRENKCSESEFKICCSSVGLGRNTWSLDLDLILFVLLLYFSLPLCGLIVTFRSQTCSVQPVLMLYCTSSLYSTLLYCAVSCCAPLYTVLQSAEKQCSVKVTVQYSTVQYSIVQYSTVQLT